MGSRPGAVAALSLAALLGFVSSAARAVPPRASGADGVVEALERAPAAVVGTVGKTRRLDRQAHAATLRVEVALAGPVPKGTEIEMAWEELSAARGLRFAEGERIAVALEPLPTASIWRQRLPDAARRGETSTVAERGRAFVRDPSQGSVLALQHFLALAPVDRQAPAGVEQLCRLAAGAQPQLARSSAQRLASVPGLDAKLSPRSASLLVDALVRSDVELQAELLELIGSRHLESLRAPLEARIAAASGKGPATAGPAVIYAALGRLDGTLSPERTALLLAQPSPAHRRRAARYASGPGASEQLEVLVRSDPEPEVRVAALERLVELRGDAAVEPLLRALGDPERTVRGAAAGRLAMLGEPAMPGLRQAAFGNDLEAARSSVAALAVSGPDGREVLVEIAESHPDAGVRTLAEIALGRPIGHED